MEQEHRNIGVALLRSNKLIRTTNKWQILLAHVMHPFTTLLRSAGVSPALLSGFDESCHHLVTR
jgi:hypothetical protein